MAEIIKHSNIRRMRQAEVLSVMGWSLSTLNERIRDGRFIKPVYEGKTPFWYAPEVEKFVMDFFGVDQDNHSKSA